MLTEDKFNKGLQLDEQLKYSIEYNKACLFNIIYTNLADKLLNMEPYTTLLTTEQRNKLQQIIDKQ